MTTPPPSIHELFSAPRIKTRVQELAKQISADYQNSELTIVGILKGSFVFVADLCRELTLPCRLEWISIASYGEQTQSSGVVRMTGDLTQPIDGKHVLVVEDIVDTGLTLSYLLESLRLRKPHTLRVCALLDKPVRRRVLVPLDYSGFSIADEFVVGYGLDYAGQYRNLPFIGVLQNHK